MPYPLPEEGPPYTAGLRWFLVAVPDDVAFVRAALGAYTEFTKYWVWGKEGKEAGRNEAAQVWESAVAATLEALEMGFPDILLGHIDEVEDLLRQLSALSGCCGELSHPFADLLTDPWQDGDPVPENIVDAGFATSTSDQAGYTDYKCLIANVAVQDLIEKINRLAQLIDESNWVVGGVAAIASILTFVVALPAAATVLTAMALGLVAGAGTAAGVWAWLNGVGKATAESTALALDAVYDELVCAIYQADGPDAATTAVAAVISDATNAAASLALTPVISMVIHALYAGRYDQTDTAAALANAGFTLAQHNCSCAIQYDFMDETDFTQSAVGYWYSQQTTFTGAGNPCETPARVYGGTPGGTSPMVAITPSGSAARAGYSYTEGSSFYLEQVEVTLCQVGTSPHDEPVILLNHVGAVRETRVLTAGTNTFVPANSGLPLALAGINYDRAVTFPGGALYPSQGWLTNVKLYWTVVAP